MSNQKLEHLFQLQKNLVDRYMQLPEYQGMTNEQMLEKMTIASLVETVESLNELPWKPWKKDKAVDKAKALEEMADELHFLLHRALLLGFGPDDLYDAYVKKNEENNRRLDGKSEKVGYTAVEKQCAVADALSDEDRIKANMICVRIAGASPLSLEEVKKDYYALVCRMIGEGASNDLIFRTVRQSIEERKA